MLFFISCESKRESKQKSKEAIETNVVAQNLQQVKVDIKGMTCEIGCARLIQSKLYRADGVTYAKISFEDISISCAGNDAGAIQVLIVKLLLFFNSQLPLANP